MKTLNWSHWKTYLLLAVFLFLVGYNMKAYTKYMIQKPLLTVLSEAPHGDFWAAWPGYYVDSYNPALTRDRYTQASPGWVYGPVLHLVTLPFTVLPSIQAAGMGILMLYNVAFAATFLIWYQLLFPRARTVWPFLTMLLLWTTYVPIYWAFSETDIEIIEMFLISLSLYFLLQRRDRAAGVAMGCAAMTKFLPFIFLPYFALKRRGAAFWSMLVTVGGIGLLTQILLGWEHNTVWGHSFVPTGTYFRYQNLGALITKFWSDYAFPFAHVQHPAVAGVVSWVAHVVVCGLVGWAFIKQCRSQHVIFEYALLTTWMITTVPHNHMYYLCMLILPFSIGLQFLFRASRAERITLGALLLIPYTLTSLLFSHLKFLKHAVSDQVLARYWDWNHLLWTFTVPALGLMSMLGLLWWMYVRADRADGVWARHLQHLAARDLTTPTGR